MNQYEKYKPIEFEWIGEIPSHWNVKKIKYTASINDDTLPETTDDNLAISYVDISSIDQGRVASKESYYFVDAPSRARRTVKDGDIIVSTVRTYLKAIARIKKPEVNLVVSTGFAVIRPYEIVPDFLGNLFLSDFLISEIISRSVGVSYPAINSSQIGEISIPIPPPPEQIAIANFLDEKTSQINKLISKKINLIELLKEERVAIINSVVSGEGKKWEKKKLKYIGEAIIGITYSPDDIMHDGKGILVLRSSNIQGGALSFDDNVYVLKQIRDKQLTKKNDILICARNGSAHLVGKCALIDEPHIGLTFGAFMSVFRSTYGEFLYYYFNSDLFRRNIGLFSTSTINQLTSDTLNNLIVAIPESQEELIKVTKYLYDETKRIDNTIMKIEQEIKLMIEYKTALISEAVTGKIKVV